LDIGQNYNHFETNKTEAFLKKFASGKIPAFEDKEGFTLFESKAIAKYGQYLFSDYFWGRMAFK
jgi:elongation factor 1-gamma